MPAQQVPPADIEALGESDILFVDTSHTVKLGGDVNPVVLEVLPLWRPASSCTSTTSGCRTSTTARWSRAADVLGRAVPAPGVSRGKAGVEVVFAIQAVARAEPERLQALIPAYEGKNFPSSFWLRRQVKADLG